MVKKRKYGDAWRDVQIDAEQNDAVFDRFFKRTPPPPPPAIGPGPQRSDRGTGGASFDVKTEPVTSSSSVPATVDVAAKHEVSQALRPSRSKATVNKIESNLGFIPSKRDDTGLRIEALRQQYRLSKGEAAILKSLLGSAMGKGSTTCYTKIPLLSEACNMTHRGCQFALKNLQGRGLITKIRDYDPTDRLGIEFQINIPLD